MVLTDPARKGLDLRMAPGFSTDKPFLGFLRPPQVILEKVVIIGVSNG